MSHHHRSRESFCHRLQNPPISLPRAQLPFLRGRLHSSGAGQTPLVLEALPRHFTQVLSPHASVSGRDGAAVAQRLSVPTGDQGSSSQLRPGIQEHLLTRTGVQQILRGRFPVGSFGGADAYFWDHGAREEDQWFGAHGRYAQPQETTRDVLDLRRQGPLTYIYVPL